MLKFVSNENELKKFFDIVLPPLTEEEVYFTSLSARNKQLTEEERRYYDLGRTEMFERKIIREKDWMKFRRTISKYEIDEAGLTGRSGVALPMHCLIIYLNINPCNMLKAYKLFQDNMNENIFNLVSRKGSSPDFFKKIDRLLMNCIQKSSGTKHYIDIDIDYNKGVQFDFLNSVCNAFKEKGVEYFVIGTKGGFHILLKKDTIKFNYNAVINEFQREVIANKHLEIKEIGINTNNMIPLPGTFQAEFPVTVWYEMSNFSLDKSQ